jgi:isopenicillin N synthase-like dioxygenase
MGATVSTPATERIPTIDLAAALRGDWDARRQAARQIDWACREIGFFLITGHGVDDGLIAALRRVGSAFFDLPADRKLAYEAGGNDNYAGYVGREALSYSLGNVSPPDLKESYTVYPPDRPDEMANPWPIEVDDFRNVVTQYFAAVDGLAAEVMRLFALGLGLPENYFDAMLDHSLSALRLLFYPPITQEPEPGQLRAGAHSDFGSLTILLTDAALGGLQVLSKSGAWIDVPYVPGAFVLNIGDLMERWTNDRWVSTLHRVVAPPVGPGSRRLSAAFFHQPNDEVLVTPLPGCLEEGEPALYPAVTSGDHLRLKVRLQREMETAAVR